MSTPLKFIYYLLERITDINNKILFLKKIFDDQNNISEQILNEINILKSENIKIQNDFEISENKNNLLIDELEILKNDYIKFKNDIIQCSSIDAIYSQDNPMKPKVFYDKRNCMNYLDKRLADFLDVDESSKMCITEVMKLIYKYIEDNNLRNKMDIKIISADLPLKKLLKIEGKTTILTYANIQYYIQPLLKPILNKTLTI